MVTFTEEILNGKLRFLCRGKKINYLKFKPKYHTTVEENEQTIGIEKKSNEEHKWSYAAVLKRNSNSNLRRKFSKQNFTENNINDSVKSSVLNARRNRSTSRNKSSEASKLQKTVDYEKATLQKKIETLKQKSNH